MTDTLDCAEYDSPLSGCCANGQTYMTEISTHEEDWPMRFLVEYAVAYVKTRDAEGLDSVTAPRRHHCAKVGSQQSELGGGHVGDYHGPIRSGEECVSSPRR